ncbi:hypothetical protein TCAL_10141 [Tigriopus californicus]|uniref:Ig-like domain-containing protein n=1 Tax=Tigriopus californicus TaxID=6832 RepID=A0A553PFW7_TIGCA|nr:hypothetical protein TCAL_10141 [Tigriopus californicus]
MVGFKLILTALLAFEISALELLASELMCSDLQVTVRAHEHVIPWFSKEYYLKYQQKDSSLVCTLEVAPDVTEFHVSSFQLEHVLVEWLFYPEYVNLQDLKEDYERIHTDLAQSQLQEQPCRFPVSNQVPSLPSDNKIPMCKEHSSRALDLTIDHRGRKFRSQLTFNKALVNHSGTYQCRWRWKEETNCLVKTRSGTTQSKHLPGHDPHRSGTIYVKVFKLRNYFEDVATIFVASAALLVVIFVLWCLDTHLKRMNMHHVPPEHL